MKWQKSVSRICVVGLSILILVSFFTNLVKADWVHYLIIDLHEPDWTLVGEEEGDWAGYFASPAGDVNGDGLEDFLIGAPMAGNKVCPYPLNPDGSCPALEKGEGVAYIIFGREGEPSPDPINLEQADVSIIGCEVESMTARQLFTAGDVNGDGYDDILISGWKCGEDYVGKTYLFLGRPNFNAFYSVDDADASFLGENKMDFFSYYAATAGDVNADGFADFLVTTTHFEYDEPCPPGSTEENAGCCNCLTKNAEQLDIENESWVLVGQLTDQRMNHTAIKYNDGVLVVGGKNTNSYLTSTEIFDSLTEIWNPSSDLNTARSSHTMTEISDAKLLVAGGENTSGALNSAELFDPTTLIWSITGNMNVPRFDHTATTLLNGMVLVVGGQNISGALSSVELYDPLTGNWTSTNDMNISRYNHTATLMPDGKVLIIGGQNNSGELSSTELYDPFTEEWTVGENMWSARADHTTTMIPGSNELLVTGGQINLEAIETSELLDLASGIWSSVGSLNEGRFSHTANLLTDGRVVVIGGQNYRGSLLNYEYYSPITETWETDPLKQLSSSRTDHTATNLSEDSVLVVGGKNCYDIGKVYLILGRPEADWGLDFEMSNADATFIGENEMDRIGRAIAGVGDVNGDDYGDFLIGSISSDTAGDNAGENYLFFGRPSEDDPDYDPDNPWWGLDYSVAGADASFVGEEPGDETGRRVSWVGDVNGDGLDDLLMQAALNDYSDVDAGITYLVLGKSEGDWGMRFSLANADASFTGENRREQSGRRISGAGDVNYDGYNDFLIGAPHSTAGDPDEIIATGKAYLIYGKPEADWGKYYPLARADVQFIGKVEMPFAGYDIAWLKDFNGDDIDDYLIAAFGGRNNTEFPGEVYVFLGSETPIPVEFSSTIIEAYDHPLIVYTGQYWEPNGWDDIYIVEMMLIEQGTGVEIKLRYERNTDLMYLYDDQIDDWSEPCVPGDQSILQNSVVRLLCGGSKSIADENHALQVSWRIRWLTSIDDKTFDVFLRGVDQSANDSQLEYLGTWTLLANKMFLPIILQ